MEKAIISGLTKEESNRFIEHVNLVLASKGDANILSDEERINLRQLLAKSMLTQGVFTEAEMKNYI